MVEIGEKERAPGGFPVELARAAFAGIRPAFDTLRAATNLHLVVHPGGHVFQGDVFREGLPRVLGTPGTGRPPRPDAGAESTWLREATVRLLKGSRVTASDGSVFYTPDGHGHYRALWTRDFAYMVEYAGDLLPPHEVRVCLDRLIAGIRADGAAPDRVRPDGVPVYVAGPDDRPLGKPNLDNAQFLVIAASCLLEGLGPEAAQPLFEQWRGALDRAMEYIPRADSGLVWNDPADPHSPYGFTDTVGKNGELFYESLLYWQASRKLAALHKRFGAPDRAADLLRRARAIEASLHVLWDPEAGAFLAATGDCRQIDVWGNAYAIWLDFPLGKRRGPVLDFLSESHGKFIWRGQVRHLPKPEHWQRLLTPVEPERYQNGAYWAAASGWMMYALAQKDRALARTMWTDLISDFKAGGICECINEGYRQLPDYVVSGANPLGAARRLRY